MTEHKAWELLSAMILATNDFVESVSQCLYEDLGINVDHWSETEALRKVLKETQDDLASYIDNREGEADA